MHLLLDTVVFILAAETPERLSHKAQKALRTGGPCELSVVSISEIALKNSTGKLAFGRDAVLRVIQELQLRILPYTLEHATELFDLPMHHRDPFDRQIIAQALAEDIPVVTCDQQFRLYESLTVIW
jgi:PIN domain nuclease of toxin-antitoxin system